MALSPPPYVPVVEYVLKALEHPPFMYVAKLAACCTVLFLTRENHELLQDLCRKWALRFRQDRSKLITSIRNRASYCVNSPDASMELEMSDKGMSEEVGDSTDGERSSRDTRTNEDGEDAAFGGIGCCNIDTAMEHLLSILNTLVPIYFSWNWHRADYVIQINKEYEAYVREFLLPVCTALAPEEGVDDEERTPWLLPPHTYLDATVSNSSFYTPTSSTGPFPPTKGISATDSRYGAPSGSGNVNNSSGGGILAVPKPAAAPSGAPTELDGLSFSAMPNHFVSTPKGRKSSERHSGVTANPLPRFSPLHPSSSRNGKELPTSSPGQGPASSTVTHTMQPANIQMSSSTVSVPAMSPNVMSAGVFNTSAVYGLRFLSLGTYRAALQHNTRGLVTVFHAKYSTRSNEVIEAFQKIAAKRLLNPMPTIAVVYAVAEPELSTLYKVSWFPTIVYTPPLFAQEHHKRGGAKELGAGGAQSQREGEAAAKSRLSAGTKRLSVMERRGKHSGRQHSHTHPRRRSTKSGATTQVQSTSSRPLSGSDSLLDLAPSTGAEQYEEEERAKWEAPSREAASPVSKRNSEIAPGGATPRVVIPLQSLSTNKAAGSTVAVPLAATTIAGAAAPTHLSSSVASQPDNVSVSAPSCTSHHLSAKVPMTPTPTELLFGISVGEPMSPGTECSATLPAGDGGGDGGGSVDESSLPSSSEDNGAAQPTHAAWPLQQTLLDLIEDDDHVIYPLRGDLTVPALVEWISARGASVPRLSKLKDPSICVKAVRKEEKFKRYRDLHSAVVTLRRLQGQGQGSASASSSDAGTSPTRTKAPQQPDRPLFIFLGGGMAAGKTTAVAALAKSSWWQGHKEQSVIVNADEFKVPQEYEASSADAHKHSTRAAENLLVKAVNQGRSIVLDGTMMWKPFVQHVVNMVRAAHLTLFKQGAGYDPKTKTEQYFVADKARQPALPFPYKIIFLGITVDVETAVPRGFQRKFSSNRGVPISMQLRSFKMFSENFAAYVAMMDETTLYNNNVFVDLEKGELPPVMAECTEETGHKLVIHDEAAFQQFVKQQQINENADNVTQVYPSSPSLQEVPS